MTLREDQRGFALVIVLYSLAYIALAAMALVTDTRVEVKLLAVERGAAVASAAAEAAVAASILELTSSRRAIPLHRRVGAANVVLRLEDQSGRINPNLVSLTVLQALLTRLGDEPRHANALAAAIVDWRNPGLLPSPNGAKAEQYRAAGLSYGPPGKPFEHLDELGAVLGMTPALLAAMAPHLTLWSIDDPDIANADAMVLSALRDAGMPLLAPAGETARVIAISAIASVPEAPRVMRRAVVRFGPSPDGRAWRILGWDDGSEP